MLAFKITTLAVAAGAVGAGLVAEFLSSDFGAEVLLAIMACLA
jgi:hypothetical protein